MSGYDKPAHPPGVAAASDPMLRCRVVPPPEKVAWTCPEPPCKAEPRPLNAALKVRHENSGGGHSESHSLAAGHMHEPCSRATGLLGSGGGCRAHTAPGFDPQTPAGQAWGSTRYLEQQSKAAVLGDEDRSGRDAAGEGKKEKD